MKIDDSFFIRLDESFYQLEDKTQKEFSYRNKQGVLETKEISNKVVTKYPFFQTRREEKNYHKNYPTIYHLRKHLMENEEPDLRKIYLGIHHIMKYRGHFTNQGQKFDIQNINVAESLTEVLEKFENASDFYFGVSKKEQDEANKLLKEKNISKSKKADNLSEYYAIDAEIVYHANNSSFESEYDNLSERNKEKFIKERQKQIKALFVALVGNGIDLSKIFNKQDYKSTNDNSFSKADDFKYSKEDFDNKIAELESLISPEELDVIISGKKVYEAIVLSDILTKENLSASMIERYNLHKEQLAELKENSKKVSEELYEKIFETNGPYEAYTKGRVVSKREKQLKKEEFYAELKDILEKVVNMMKFSKKDKQPLEFPNEEFNSELREYFEKILAMIQKGNFLSNHKKSKNYEEQLTELKENSKKVSVELYDKIFKTDGPYEIYAKGEIVSNKAEKLKKEAFYKELKDILEKEVRGIKFPKRDNQSLEFLDEELNPELREYFEKIFTMMQKGKLLSNLKNFKNYEEQLSELKENTEKFSAELYDEIFKTNGPYEAYTKGRIALKKEKVLTKEDFYEELKTILEKGVNGIKFPTKDNQPLEFSNEEFNPELREYFEKTWAMMQEGNFLPKQRTNDNGAIPYQVHEYELIKIIEKQSNLFPFLAEKVSIKTDDEQATTEEYQLQTLFKFRIPYYVGTLAKKSGWIKQNDKLIQTDAYSKNAWLVRKTQDKITPWNFDEVVDKEKSATNFIERMTNFDTYLPCEKVLPNNSLLYQEFKIFNELIVSGYYQDGKKCYFQSEMRKAIFNDLFKKKRKVTAKALIDYLYQKHHIKLESQKALFGIDTFINNAHFNTSYTTYHDLKMIVDEQKIQTYKENFELIIKWQTIFEDKKMLKKTIKNANEEWQILSDDEIEALSKKHYTGWGRLSKKLLSGIRAQNGLTIIENLKNGEYRNFMRLLEDEKIAKIIAEEQKGLDGHELTYDLVDALAGSPAIKKGIWQSLKIIKELEDYLGKESIAQIVIEMSRENSNGRTIKRKKQIENFYKTFLDKTGEKISSQLQEELKFKKDEDFNSEKLYLYFIQNGRCMYTHSELKISELSSYDVDHIIPQTFIKDDSLNNKVLVTQSANRSKGGDTPSAEIIANMRGFWELLAKNNQISRKKLQNLTTKSGTYQKMDEREFINRQLVESRQITKHVANMLGDYFDNEVEILVPKASLTTQFRDGVVYIPKQDFDFSNEKNYEYDKKYVGHSCEHISESSYSNSNFVKKHYHAGFPKSREINDYHHAHDAFLNAIVAKYLYAAYPSYKDMWVYGKYQKDEKKITGKYATQRQAFHKQILNGMADKAWINMETGKVFAKRDAVLKNIEATLNYTNCNIVRMYSEGKGKFYDETLYRKNTELIPVKSYGDGEKYGGKKSINPAYSVIVKYKMDNADGEIVKIDVFSVMLLNKKKAEENLKAFIQETHPEWKEIEILVPKLLNNQIIITDEGIRRMFRSWNKSEGIVFNKGQQIILSPNDFHTFIYFSKASDAKRQHLYNFLLETLEEQQLLSGNVLDSFKTLKQQFLKLPIEDIIQKEVVNGKKKEVVKDIGQKSIILGMVNYVRAGKKGSKDKKLSQLGKEDFETTKQEVLPKNFGKQLNNKIVKMGIGKHITIENYILLHQSTTGLSEVRILLK